MRLGSIHGAEVRWGINFIADIYFYEIMLPACCLSRARIVETVFAVKECDPLEYWELYAATKYFNVGQAVSRNQDFCQL